MRRPSAAAGIGIGAAAAAATAAAELNAAIQLETVHMKIDFNGLGAIQKFLVDDVFETAHIEFLILFIRLIQSHGQAGSASAAFVEKNADGLDILAVEIGRDLFRGRTGNF